MLQAFLGFFAKPKPAPTAEMNNSMWNWLTNFFKWSPTSSELLEEAEKNILSHVKQPFTLKFVSIPGISNDGTQLQIRTLCMNSQKNQIAYRTPLVLLHGLGAGIGLWVLNLDAFAQQGPVYAVDVLGFGMSSRPKFSTNAAQVEEQLVESIENWRKGMSLENFILLGHSMGGYLATSYAIKYPDKVKHLILADPWGFPERDKTIAPIQLPLWIKAVSSVLGYFNPFTPLRVAGPLGPSLVAKFRPDILLKFTPIIDNSEVISKYIYHCNAQDPSGESAFKTLSGGFGWAKLPMITRIDNLSENVPITFIYGSRSWVDCHTGYCIKKMRQNSSVEVKMISGAGHHIYADRADVFNSTVLEVCQQVNNFTLDCHKNNLEKSKEGCEEDENTIALEVRVL